MKDRTVSRILLVLFMLLISSPAWASQDFSLLGRLASGPCNDVTISGNTAYYGNGGFIEIVDLTSPDHPIPLGRALLPSQPLGLAIKDHYVFAACGQDGLRIVDALDPINAIEVGACDTPGSAMDVYVSGQTAYVADKLSGLAIIDVSDPKIPVEVGRFQDPDFSDIVSVCVEDDIAFLSANSWYMENTTVVHVVDVSDPADLKYLGYIPSYGYAGNLTIDSDRLYYMYYDGLAVYDISKVTDPVLVCTCNVQGHQGHGVAVSGDLAYVTDKQGSLSVIDLSLQTAATEINVFPTEGGALDLAVLGDYVLVAGGNTGLRIIDVQDPGVVVETGYLATAASTWGVTFAGDLALVAKSNDGLQVVDMSDPTMPTVLGACDFPEQAYDVVHQDSLAYVANGRDGLRIVGFSDPTSPEMIGYWPTEMMVLDLAVSGDYAYLADFAHDLQVIDISDPTAPVRVGQWSSSGRLYGIDLVGNLAYVTDYQEGLRIIDVGDPTEPVEIGFWESPGCVLGLDVVGNYAYVADMFEGLRVVNIEDPSTPYEVGFYAGLEGWDQSVAVVDGYAFLTSHEGAVQMLDVSDPSTPKWISTFDTGGYTRDVAVSESDDRLTVMLADGPLGVWVLGVDLGMTTVPAAGLPSFINLAQNYPNPFNPATAIEFELKRATDVSLTVFDLSGRRVKGLVQAEQRSAGRHSVSWYGCDDLGRSMPSGLYLYRLQAGSDVQTRTMTLVR